LKAAPDKLQNFLRISLALLAGKKWSEYHLKHWTGKAAFIAAFMKFLFSNLIQGFSAHRAISLRRRGSNKGVCG